MRVSDADSLPWWSAVQERRLLIPGCGACGLRWFPPTPGCPRCGSTAVSLAPSEGRGRIYSWVIANRALSDAFAAEAPYAILAVELEEGARMFGRLLGDPADPRIASRSAVTADYYEAGGQVLVGFRLS